jgi:hypothetical protein
MITYGLIYASNNDVQLHGFTNLHWEGSADDRKSTYRLCFSLGSAMMSWASRKQNFVSLSTMESYYISSCDACIEVVWIHNIVYGLFYQLLDSTVIYCDNQSYVKLS